MGFVDIGYESVGCEIFVEVIGEAVAAVVVEPDLYDPAYAHVRG